MRKAVESTTVGQPDKVCDQIADALVDEYLRRDPQAHIDLDVMGSHGMLMIGGEASSKADFDLAELARRVYHEIGYTDEIEVFVNIERQSKEMEGSRGASDTVIVHGYATAETREMLPRPLVFAHALTRRIDNLRRNDPSFAWLRPDGKVQLVLERDRVRTVTVLASHDASVNTRDVQTIILDRIVTPVVGEEGAQIFINPIGSFTTFGFQADSGASGRKQATDTYGALIPHGDNHLSGKDPHKAERAGAYMARYVARQLVSQGFATSAFVTLVYTLGRAEPVHVEAKGTGGTEGTGVAKDLTEVAKKQFDFRPDAIVERFSLARPIYQSTAVYGHFGRAEFPWES